MSTIDIPPALDKLVAKWSAKTGRTREQFVLAAIEEYVADFRDSEIIERRLKSSKKRIPLAEVERKLGLGR